MDAAACGMHNGATPKIEVDPETYEVKADGELLTCAGPTSAPPPPAAGEPGLIGAA